MQTVARPEITVGLPRRTVESGGVPGDPPEYDGQPSRLNQLNPGGALPWYEQLFGSQSALLATQT